MDLKRLLRRGALFLPAFMLTVAMASAVSVYSVTETTATVGSATNFEIEYTVDTTVQTWADGDTISFQLPAPLGNWENMTYSVEYDSDMNNNGAGETAITQGVGNGQYGFAGGTLTVKWDVSTWGAVVNNASTIRVLITGGGTPQYAQTGAPFNFGGSTVAGGDTNPSGSDTINIVAADAAASVTLGDNQYVGDSGTTTLTLYIAYALATSDTVVFTLPAHLDLSGLDTATTDTFAGAGGFTCADAGQTITCTTTGAITAGTGTIVMTGIVATTTATGATLSSLAVNDVSNGGADISSDSSGTVTDVVAAATGGGSYRTVTAPSEFELSLDSEGVLLTWTDPSSGSDAQKIEILRGLNGIPVSGTPYALVDLGVGQYLDTDLEEGDEVAYIIRARDSSGTYKSSNSEEVEITFTVTADEDEEADDSDDSTSDEDEAADEDQDAEEPSEDDESTDENEAEDDESDDDNSFSDMDDSHWAFADVQTMTDLSIVEGNPDGSFAPEDSLNRAEAATLLERIYLALGGTASTDADAEFTDVDGTEWYAGSVFQLHAIGVINGNPDGSFAPDQNVNRAEFIAMAIRLYEASVDANVLATEGEEPFEDSSDSDWFYAEVKAAYNLSFVNGESCDAGTCYNPGDEITRAEATAILNRMFGSLL